MIAAVAVHSAIHWNWVQGMAKRVAKSATGKGAHLNRHGVFNVVIDAAVALGFLLAAISGIYFLFAGRDRAAANFVFSRTTWDLIHTWSGVATIMAAVIHFAIHWRWVTKVTRNVFRSLRPQPAPIGGSVAERAGA